MMPATAGGKVDMSKNTAANRPVTMSEVGDQLLFKLVELYESQTFVREGKTLRENMLENGVKAAALLSSVSLLAERRAKLDALNKAVVYVANTACTIRTMIMLGLYTQKQAGGHVKFCVHLNAAISELLKKVPESKKVIRVKSPVNVVNSVGGVIEDVSAGAGDGFDYEETTDLDSIASMPDGFDEPA